LDRHRGGPATKTFRDYADLEQIGRRQERGKGARQGESSVLSEKRMGKIRGELRWNPGKKTKQSAREGGAIAKERRSRGPGSGFL